MIFTPPKGLLYTTLYHSDRLWPRLACLALDNGNTIFAPDVESECAVKAREPALVEMHGGFLHACGLEICSYNDTFTKCLCCLSGIETCLFGESGRPVEVMGSCKCWRM